jgi:hypothetical protein
MIPLFAEAADERIVKQGFLLMQVLYGVVY